MPDPDGNIMKVVQTGDRLAEQTNAGEVVRTVQFVEIVTGVNGTDGRPQSIDDADNVAMLVTFEGGINAVYVGRMVGKP